MIYAKKRQQFQVMSFPKLNDFIGKGKVEYKRVSLIHSIKNSLTRNTIIESCKKPIKPYQNALQSAPKPQTPSNTLQPVQPSSQFKYQQKMPASFTFSTQDLYKLLQHLFNKKEQDLHDRNFIRRLMLKHFPQELICAGGRDFVSLLKFDKLRKGQRKVFDQKYMGKQQRQQNSQQQLSKSSQRNFYFILKGKVRVFTEQFTYKKQSGQYFGQLQILGNQKILQIEAKSDTMLLYLPEQIFTKHLSHYFCSIYQQIRKKISLFEPILALAPLYNQYRFLESLYQKQYKTGDKIYHKNQQILQIIFLNHTEISSTEDKLLNEFRTVGLGEVLYMQRPKAKETTYCMDNKTVYVMKANDFLSFIDKQIISTYLSLNYNFTTLSSSKLAPDSEQATIKGTQKNTPKLSTFVNIKRVRFTNNKRRVLTQPNLSICLHSPTSSSKPTPTYPQYATSFVFIKQNASACFTQMKNNRLKGLRGDNNSRRTDIKEYLLKTRDSFRKKRWLDEIDGTMEGSLICNPEIIEKKKDQIVVKELVVGG